MNVCVNDADSKPLKDGNTHLLTDIIDTVEKKNNNNDRDVDPRVDK